jgi:hypothetical protein
MPAETPMQEEYWTRTTQIHTRVVELEKKVIEGKASEEEIEEYNIWQPFLLRVEPLTFEKMLLFMVAAKYLHTPEGMKQLAGIATKYLDAVGGTMSSLAKAGASHALATVINGYVAASVYGTMGLVSPEQLASIQSWLRGTLNKLIISGALGDIASVGTMVFGSGGVVSALGK